MFSGQSTFSNILQKIGFYSDRREERLPLLQAVVVDAPAARPASPLTYDFLQPRESSALLAEDAYFDQQDSLYSETRATYQLLTAKMSAVREAITADPATRIRMIRNRLAAVAAGGSVLTTLMSALLLWRYLSIASNAAAAAAATAAQHQPILDRLKQALEPEIDYVLRHYFNESDRPRARGLLFVKHLQEIISVVGKFAYYPEFRMVYVFFEEEQKESEALHCPKQIQSWLWDENHFDECRSGKFNIPVSSIPKCNDYLFNVCDIARLAGLDDGGISHYFALSELANDKPPGNYSYSPLWTSYHIHKETHIIASAFSDYFEGHAQDTYPYWAALAVISMISLSMLAILIYRFLYQRSEYTEAVAHAERSVAQLQVSDLDAVDAADVIETAEKFSQPVTGQTTLLAAASQLSRSARIFKQQAREQGLYQATLFGRLPPEMKKVIAGYAYGEFDRSTDNALLSWKSNR